MLLLQIQTCLPYLSSNLQDKNPSPIINTSAITVPHLIDLSRTITVATTPSIRSMDFSLSGLMFQAESVLIKILYCHNPDVFFLQRFVPKHEPSPICRSNRFSCRLQLHLYLPNLQDCHQLLLHILFRGWTL